MIKFSTNTDFNFDVPAVSIVYDNSSLTKRASAKDLLKFEKTPNQTDLHIIALGAYEGTGFNRNGDAFTEADCEKNHHYFKKADRAVHRHHKNKPEDPKYGNIKAAAYNKAMKRIELIVGLDNDKCADILDEQEKKGETGWSMASRQPLGDKCTWCSHVAKDDHSRCEHIPSKIGELNDRGVMCGMMNPDPRWFEISKVGRQADRIGVSLKLADERIKPMLPSDYLQLYTGFHPPEDEFLVSKKATDKRDILRKLAEMEKHIDAIAGGKAKNTSKDLFLKRQARLKKSPPIEDKDIDELRKHPAEKTMRCLGDNGVILSPDEFTKYLFGNRAKDEVSKGMKTHLPHVFSKMEEDGNGEAVNDEKFEPDALGLLPKELKSLVSRLFDGHSMLGGPSVKRVMRITIEMGPKNDDVDLKPKEAPTKNKADEKLAEVYASYKLAALNHLQENNALTDEVLWNVLIQNR